MKEFSMNLCEAKELLEKSGYTITESVDADDWYRSTARDELERYMLNLVVPEVCKNCNITTEEFWKCFQDEAYMDYMLPIGRSTIAEWANNGIKRMSEEYRLRNS